MYIDFVCKYNKFSMNTSESISEGSVSNVFADIHISVFKSFRRKIIYFQSSSPNHLNDFSNDPDVFPKTFRYFRQTNGMNPENHLDDFWGKAWI